MEVFIVFVLPILVSALVAFFVAKKVYKTLVKKENKNAMLWSIFVFIITGLLVGLLCAVLIFTQLFAFSIHT